MVASGLSIASFWGTHHLLAAVHVDTQGSKHVLGIPEAASKNQVMAKRPLETLVERGLDRNRRYLFVIDGSGFGSPVRSTGVRKPDLRPLERPLRLAAQGSSAVAWKSDDPL